MCICAFVVCTCLSVCVECVSSPTRPYYWLVPTFFPELPCHSGMARSSETSRGPT